MSENSIQFNKSVQQWLSAYMSASYSFFNTGSKEKKIFTKWKEYTLRKPSRSEIKQWLSSPIQNYAICTGEISNLIVIDVDTHKGGNPKPFLELQNTYAVRTPSGGYHFYFLYDESLAITRHDNQGFLKSIDIQSNGAVVFAPPTQFAPDRRYTLINNNKIRAIPDELLKKIITHILPPSPKTLHPNYRPADPRSNRPGDIFNALMSWPEVLEPLGWSFVFEKGGVSYWRRPGKKLGISASTNYHGYDLFFPYTTHFPELETKRGYSKFRLYAIFRHDSDWSKAAKELVIENYKKVIGIYEK